MDKEILSLKFINVKDNFLHFSTSTYKNFSNHSVCGFRCVIDESTYYFSSSAYPHSNVPNDSVGISPTYARLLRLKENDVLILTPLYNLGSIKRVFVSPASDDDFEILSTSSSLVENTLLNQLRLVWLQQTFCAWISNNICVSLVVDSLSPDIQFGRLEEYSEVIVGNVVKNNNNVINPDRNMIPNYMKKTTIKNKWIFRSVPILYNFEKNDQFCTQPYVVYTSKENLDDDLIALNDSVCKLSTYNWSNETEINRELWVQLKIINQDFIGYDTCGIKNLYVSESLKKILNLKLGSKVYLIPIKKDKNKEIMGILVTPLFQCKNEDTLKLEIYNTLLNNIIQNGNLLLNTKAEFPLDKRKRVIFTLRPLDIGYSFLMITSLKDLKITINEHTPDIVNDESLTLENDSSIKSFEQLINDAKLSSELTLNLKDFKKRRCNFFDNILITGPKSSGKTTLVNRLISILSDSPYYLYSEKLDCCSLKGKRIESISNKLIYSLNACKYNQPSILFLDDICTLASAPKSENESVEIGMHMNRMSYKILEVIEEFQKDNSIMVVACALNLESVNSILYSPRGKSVFKTVLNIPELNKDDRYLCIEQLLNLKLKKNSIKEEDLTKIAVGTEGFMVSDLTNLINKSFFEAYQRKGIRNTRLSINYSDIELSLNQLKPTLLHDMNMSKKAIYNFSNVGGLKEAKDKLTEVILWPLLFPDIMKQCPLKSQNNVLIYGAPGTGKTLLANAIAGESKLNFISVKGPELMSKYIGQSEEGVRNIFKKAQAAKPCLLFFDEFDSLAPKRGKDQTGVTDRVVNQLLTALDGVEPLNGVCIIAASSRPDLIDPALLRPGRIGSSIMCPFPNENDREDILKILSNIVKIAPETDLKEIAVQTDGFSGADLKGIFTTAQIKLIDETVESLFEGASTVIPSILKDKKETELTQDHILAAVKETKPSLRASERAKFEKIYYEFKNPKPPEISAQKITFA